MKRVIKSAKDIEIVEYGENPLITWEGSNEPKTLDEAENFANRLLGYVEDMKYSPYK